MARHHRRTVFTVISCTLLVLALATGTLVAVFYKHLDANLHTGEAIQHVAKKKQTGPKTPLNILVLGVDTRHCAGCKIDSESGGNGSDTTILMHVSADRRSAYGISIPRDALVKPVPCTANHLYTNRGVNTGLVEWNAAYSAGGPDCTAEQLEKNFSVYVDGYVTVNFGGFQGMVNAIGGVNVCIPFKLSDPTYAHITFEPGKSVHLDGWHALQYVRLRHVYGHGLDGSDVSRMKRQQAFISSMINQAVSAGTLTRPDKLVKFANALTSSVTASPNLASVKKLVNLAEQFRHTDLSHIHFVTLPSQPYDVPESSPYWGRVEILPSAKNLWRRVIDDKPLSKALSSGSISAGAPPGSSGPSSTASPSGVPSSSGAPSTQPSNGPSAEEAAQSGLCS
jgi:LCP family protein required for cell wall assembly